MAGLLTALAAVAETIDVVSKNKDLRNTTGVVDTFLNNKKTELALTRGSLTKLLQTYIVTPVIITTHSAREVEVFDKVNELNCDIFASFYSQAFQILSTRYDLDVNTAIGVLGTDTSPYLSEAIADITSVIATMEDASYRNLMSDSLYLTTTVSHEADDDKDKGKNKTDDLNKGRNIKNKYDNDDKNPLHSILQRNLTISAKVTNKDNVSHTIEIPMTIKAHIIVTSTEGLLNMLTPTSRDKTFSARWDEYKAGSIGLKELIFCNDLIKQYKDVKLKDKNKLLDLVNNRVQSSLLRGAKSGIEGYEANYNMIVISTEDKIKIDKYIGGDILRENAKQRFLADTHALSVSIMDPDYERVNILINDIRGNSDISFKTISKRKSKDSSEMADIFKSLMLNKPIGF